MKPKFFDQLKESMEQVGSIVQDLPNGRFQMQVHGEGVEWIDVGADTVKKWPDRVFRWIKE